MPAVLSVSLLAGRSALRAAAALAAAAGRRAANLLRVIRNRHASAMLARLDDRMLADIGLTRSDLRDAFAEPMWHDPTDVLARRARERRVSRAHRADAPPLAPMGPLPCPPADRPARTLI
jgi:uncharacterized protein YjiS (DUF1127 family)